MEATALVWGPLKDLVILCSEILSSSSLDTLWAAEAGPLLLWAGWERRGPRSRLRFGGGGASLVPSLRNVLGKSSSGLGVSSRKEPGSEKWEATEGF